MQQQLFVIVFVVFQFIQLLKFIMVVVLVEQHAE